MQKKVVEANLAHIGVGTEQLWGTDKFHHIFKRMGISSGNQLGYGWKEIPGRLGQLTVGYGPVIWGVDYAGDIWFKAYGDIAMDDDLVEQFWDSVDGLLRNIDVGRDGILWGVNKETNIFYREGITPANKSGTKWVVTDGKGLAITTCPTG